MSKNYIHFKLRFTKAVHASCNGLYDARKQILNNFQTFLICKKCTLN